MKITVLANDPRYKDLAADMDRIFVQVDKVFKDMDVMLDSVQVESDEIYNKRQKWESYISWIPRKIGRRWYWHSPIYRKHQFDGSKSYYIYGTEFDVLKESK